MVLPPELKAELYDLIYKYFSHYDLDILCWRLGFEPEELTGEEGTSKRIRIQNLFTNIPENKEKDLIKHVYLKISDEEEKEELKRLVEGLMFYTIDDEGNLIPIGEPKEEFAEKLTFIEQKLSELGFNYTLQRFKKAIEIYRSDSKSSLGAMRDCLESLIKEILKSKGEKEGSVKENIEKLVVLGILKECRYRNHNWEVDYLYSLYGLLSHYGSHPKEDITEETPRFLLTSTISSTWLLLSRFINQQNANGDSVLLL